MQVRTYVWWCERCICLFHVQALLFLSTSKNTLSRYLSLALKAISSLFISGSVSPAVNHLCFSAQSPGFISYLHLRLHLPLVSCFSASFLTISQSSLQYNVDPYYWSSHTHTHVQTSTARSRHCFPDILNLSIPPHLSAEMTNVRTRSPPAPPHKMRVSLSDMKRVCGSGGDWR